MSEMSLDVPWATTSLNATALPLVTGVDVLPGYDSDTTTQLPQTLSEPWSGQPLAAPQQPAIASLDGMLL
jgi:hypothetical protein